MPTNSKELSDQIALRRARFESIVAELRAVLVDDVPNWAMREAKEAFLGAPAVASSMTEETLRTFKTDIESFGTEAAENLGDALQEASRWLEGGHHTDNPRTLRDAAVWEHLSKVVDEPFQQLLVRHGLTGGQTRHFKGPVYFVGGRYYPALAEHYWKLRTELVDLERAVAELSAEETRAALLDRWDNA